MALINCPGCNKEISDTSSECIHCGYVLKKKKTKKVITVIIASVLVIVTVGLLVKKFSLPDTPYRTFFRLMECQQPEKVKDILGKNYTRSDMEDGDIYEVYRNIQIDGLDCVFFTIDYKNDKCTGIYYEIENVDNSTKDSFFEALVDQFGDIHSYKEESYLDVKSEQYGWKNDNYFSVHINHSTEDKDGTYFIQVNVVWS